VRDTRLAARGAAHHIHILDARHAPCPGKPQESSMQQETPPPPPAAAPAAERSEAVRILALVLGIGGPAAVLGVVVVWLLG
jgi:hypothetical protein